MAIGPLLTAVVTINAVDLSDHVKSVSIETEREELDATAMGAVNKVVMAGLGDATITMTVLADYAAGEIDATLWPLSSTTTPFTVTVKPSSAATSATNPLYSMSALLFNYSPISGSVGEMNETQISFRNASQAGLTRATA